LSHSPRTRRILSAEKLARDAQVKRISGEASRLRKLIGRSAPQPPHHASGLKVWVEYANELHHLLIASAIPQALIEKETQAIAESK